LGKTKLAETMVSLKSSEATIKYWRTWKRIRNNIQIYQGKFIPPAICDA